MLLGVNFQNADWYLLYVNLSYLRTDLYGTIRAKLNFDVFTANEGVMSMSRLGHINSAVSEILQRGET